MRISDWSSDVCSSDLSANGVDVLGPTHHGIFKSIYFFDPNGHRVELACDIGTDEQYAELKRVAPLMLEEWSQTKKAPRHADWLHTAANEYQPRHCERSEAIQSPRKPP